MQVVKLARECGLVQPATIAVDGTMVKANASRHRAMSYRRMVQAETELKQQITALLKRARATDAAEANVAEQDPPAEIARREQRLAAIAAAKARLEAQQREADAAHGRHEGDERKPRHPDGTPRRGKPFKRDFGVSENSAQTSFTDPQSRIMKQPNGGFEHSYNAQTAVDAERQIIVAAALTDCAADSGQLPAMGEAMATTLGALPQAVLADPGYCSEAALKALADTPCEVMVALSREGREHTRIDKAKYPHTARMAERMKSAEGQAACRHRKAAAEAPNGWNTSVLEVPVVQSAQRGKRARRVETGAPGDEPAADGGVGMRESRGQSHHPSRRGALTLTNASATNAPARPNESTSTRRTPVQRESMTPIFF